MQWEWKRRGLYGKTMQSKTMLRSLSPDRADSKPQIDGVTNQLWIWLPSWTIVPITMH